MRNAERGAQAVMTRGMIHRKSKAAESNAPKNYLMLGSLITLGRMIDDFLQTDATQATQETTQ